MIEVSVEVMDSDELNAWVSEAIMAMKGSDRRGVATMSVMISMFQAFMEENPEVETAFQQYMNDETDEEIVH